MVVPESSAAALVLAESRFGPLELPLAGGGAVAFSARAPDKDSPNEDGCLALELAAGVGLLAVADGCGGLPHGEQAAATALASLRQELEPPRSGVDGEAVAWSTRVYAAFEAASAAVSALGGPCTTLSVVLLEDGTARPFHAGDSPILIFGQRGRRRLEVVAHSPTAYAGEAGFLVEEEAMRHEDRHLVLNALGAEGARIEIGAPVRLRQRDTVLIASDGLSDNLVTEQTVELLRAGPLEVGVAAVAAACADRMAPESGGHPDDLTLLTFRGQTSIDIRRRTSTS